MSFQQNLILAAGNLTRDPEVRKLSGDQTVADFGLAMNRRWTGTDGQAKTEATFVDVTAWGKTAEFVGKYFRKGQAIAVQGRLTLETWDDKATGAKRSKLKVTADSVSFVESAAAGGGPAARSGPAAPDAHPPAADPAKTNRNAGNALPADRGSDEPPF